MKKLLLVLGILIFADIFYFAFVNLGPVITAKYPPILEYQWDVGLAYLFMGLYGALGAFLLTYYKLLTVRDKLKKQSRNAEKSNIEAQENSDKVKALEAKVNTLEVALKEALNKK